MSYDLFISYPTPIPAQGFWGYFEQIPHFKRQSKQLFYENPDTGVYFILDANSTGDGAISDVSLNVNYWRPSAFGLEVERVITAFVTAYPGAIHDPQLQGMGDGPYTPEGFLRGWNAGNAFGYSAMRKSTKNLSEHVVLPTAKVQAMWRWNFDRARLQAEKGQSDQFIPTILALRVRERKGAGVIWGEAVAALLPRVDFVLYGNKRPELTLSMIVWEDLESILAGHGFRATSGGFDLGYKSPPPALLSELDSLPTLKLPADVMRFNFDHVLDAELIPAESGEAAVVASQQAVPEPTPPTTKPQSFWTRIFGPNAR
jgi:hypothetical protein